MIFMVQIELSEDDILDYWNMLNWELMETKQIIQGFISEGYNEGTYAHMTAKEKRLDNVRDIIKSKYKTL
jgi:hypothetical protein